MSYRADKVRQGKSVKRHEYSELRRFQLELDPLPYQCTRVGYESMRHQADWCGTFSPRPEYEQDRSKYE